jgi:hypothetical protein
MTFTFGGALNSWEAKEDVKIAHTGEKLSWHKVSTHFVVGDGVCAAFKGIFGQFLSPKHPQTPYSFESSASQFSE